MTKFLEYVDSKGLIVVYFFYYDRGFREGLGKSSVEIFSGRTFDLRRFRKAIASFRELIRKQRSDL